MPNTVLLLKNHEYFLEICGKSYFLTKYGISAQNRIRPWSECLVFRTTRNLIHVDPPHSRKGIDDYYSIHLTHFESNFTIHNCQKVLNYCK